MHTTISKEKLLGMLRDLSCQPIDIGKMIIGQLPAGRINPYYLLEINREGESYIHEISCQILIIHFPQILGRDDLLNLTASDNSSIRILAREALDKYFPERGQGEVREFISIHFPADIL